jgi:hypothetical protein
MLWHKGEVPRLVGDALGLKTMIHRSLPSIFGQVVQTVRMSMGDLVASGRKSDVPAEGTLIFFVLPAREQQGSLRKVLWRSRFSRSAGLYRPHLSSAHP